MKKLVIMLAVGILISFSTFALGQATVTWHGVGAIGGYYNGSGSVGYGVPAQGEWAVELIFTDLKGITGYTDGSTLTTFCLEMTETFDFDLNPHVYNASISNSASLGGGGPNPDPICEQTAWIYSQYLSGNNFGISDVDQRAAAVQEAIWIYEQEVALADIELAGTAAIMAQADATAVDGNFYNIAVLNLTDGNENLQSVLVKVPAPGAMLLGSIGVGLVGWFRRRKSL